jgi:heptosyltransferase III
MKILVLQLARFGDIYLTWPVLRSLRRKHPAAEIHFLVRQKFVAGLEGLGEGFTTHVLPTADILAPLYQYSDQTDDCVDASLAALENWLKPFQTETWDTILNLSFSPSSSFIAQACATLETDVRGYTRHADGFLNIPDDASAYFYAQVGVEKSNRYHLADIFAMVSETEIEASDWGYRGDLVGLPANENYLVFHLGASKTEKCFPIEAWEAVVREISQPIYLIGSKEETHLAEVLTKYPHVKNLVGQTRLPDLFPLLKNAQLLVGADSAPIHIASHMNTPVLNLSFSSVNFWETGPCSKKSFVLLKDQPSDMTTNDVCQAIRSILKGGTPSNLIGGIAGPGVRFEEQQASFEWQLIQALYTATDFPKASGDSVFSSAVNRLMETVNLALEQLSTLKENYRNKAALEILDSVDLILASLPKMSPPIAPLVNYFETQRLRIPPGTLEATFGRTEALFSELRMILQVFKTETAAILPKREQNITLMDELAGELSSCANSFRLFQTAIAEPKLQNVISRLAYMESSGVVKAATKVGSTTEFQEALGQLIQAFEKKDYIFVADILEYEISACLSDWRTAYVNS